MRFVFGKTRTLSHDFRLAALTLIIAAGCAKVSPLASSATQHTDPCQGTLLDADHPDPRCLLPNTDLLVPQPSALSIRTIPTPALIRRGQASNLTLIMRNISGAPLTLELDDSCLAFDAVARSAKGSSFESDCGGLCSRSEKKLRVTLLPGGTIHKAVRLHAIQRRIVGESCEDQNLGPLLPGRYNLHITLPWSDPAPIPGNAQARATRVFQGPLIVEP